MFIYRNASENKKIENILKCNNFECMNFVEEILKIVQSKRVTLLVIYNFKMHVTTKKILIEFEFSLSRDEFWLLVTKLIF